MYRPCVAVYLGAEMADWVRNTVMLTVLVIWAVFVCVTLIRGGDVDAIVWALPASCYFSLNPSFRKKDPTDASK